MIFGTPQKFNEIFSKVMTLSKEKSVIKVLNHTIDLFFYICNPKNLVPFVTRAEQAVIRKELLF